MNSIRLTSILSGFVVILSSLFMQEASEAINTSEALLTSANMTATSRVVPGIVKLPADQVTMNDLIAQFHPGQDTTYYQFPSGVMMYLEQPVAGTDWRPAGVFHRRPDVDLHIFDGRRNSKASNLFSARKILEKYGDLSKARLIELATLPPPAYAHHHKTDYRALLILEDGRILLLGKLRPPADPTNPVKSIELPISSLNSRTIVYATRIVEKFVKVTVPYTDTLDIERLFLKFKGTPTIYSLSPTWGDRFYDKTNEITEAQLDKMIQEAAIAEREGRPYDPRESQWNVDWDAWVKEREKMSTRP